MILSHVYIMDTLHMMLKIGSFGLIKNCIMQTPLAYASVGDVRDLVDVIKMICAELKSTATNEG